MQIETGFSEHNYITFLWGIYFRLDMPIQLIVYMFMYN
jgi:hypothetical protein